MTTPIVHYSTLIFDLDGTLSDPSLGIVRCFNHALASHGLPQAPGSTLRNCIGPPLDHSFRRLCPQADQDQVLALVASYRERYAETGYAENSLYAGIPEALAALQDRGYRLGVCTSKRRDFAERILAMFELADCFEFIDGGDIGISKSEQLAGLLARGAIDRQALMIGDREFDLNAAINNELRAVGVLWGFGDRQELAACKPLRILERPEQLRTLAD